MKNYVIFILALLFIATPCFAKKPEWAGKGKPTVEQKEARQTAMEARKNSDESEGKREKSGQEGKADKNLKVQKDEPKGLEKQKAKKMEQEQKEISRGSKKGQQSRIAPRAEKMVEVLGRINSTMKQKGCAKARFFSQRS